MTALVVDLLARKRPDLVGVLPRGALERSVFAAVAVCEPARAAIVTHWADVGVAQGLSAIKRLLADGLIEQAGWVRDPSGRRVQTYQVAR